METPCEIGFKRSYLPDVGPLRHSVHKEDSGSFLKASKRVSDHFKQLGREADRGDKDDVSVRPVLFEDVSFDDCDWGTWNALLSTQPSELCVYFNGQGG